MTPALLGTKVGMTRIYDEKGAMVPVTVVQVGPCTVTQVKTADGKDGYNAVQIAFGDVRAKRSNQATIKRCAVAGVGPKRHFREVRTKDASDQAVGSTLNASVFDGVSHVDVIGVSKGKGFAGVMKRHHFGGMCASHGTERMHRHGGSIASHATWRGQCGKPKKGLRMGGRMGGDQVTTIGHQVMKVDAENNLLIIKGALPGANGGLLFIEKSRKAKEAAAK
ncbi:MAG: 50S ribosomal protein L3 [Tepidisphaeraceae bacterium]